ncbi:MAG: hypothetical protein A2W93_14335 [Bacteroidetes bacterium GWF2_43_63]|nr:MAG: hypothetical protein A2W94_00905 [Bacteroidetes bacterium GWE2_42_42]OFY52519.1 MAG: hypothetical protein A2W93_14335 [Bacteroidetes bacterium GWF2_43_63]HBG71426.1 hypothetical protein [Bacteroidales bacterium]HCB60822.1 hypothetical protein [Bacteroidales bacterium]HCY23453.1 hypothetical protein [Bacteroidales bacterium]
MAEENIIPEVPETPVAPPAEQTTDPAAELIEAVNANNPDQPVSTPEEAIAAAVVILKDAMSYRQRTSAVNEKISEVMSSHPEFAGMLQMLIKGAPLRAAIAAYFEPEDLVPQPGDEDESAYQSAMSDRQKRSSEAKAFNEEFGKNQEMTKAEWEKFKAENNVSEEEAEQLLAEIESVANDMFNGKLSGKVLGMVHKSMNFEKALADAAESGKAEGAAEKITMTKETVGDGMPDNTGVSGDDGAMGEKKNKSAIVTRLEEMAKKKDNF